MSTNPHTRTDVGGMDPALRYRGFADHELGSVPALEPPEGFTAKHGPDGAVVRPFTTHYCPGCEHGTLTRLIGREVSRRNADDRAVAVVSVGCSVFAYNYLDVDAVQAPHGRSPAMGTGIKRSLPDHLVFMVLGDGDALAIGLSETLQAAYRGEPITIFLVNNGIYGMTGGQMAPTTLPGATSTTSPFGRQLPLHGHPVDACALLSQIPTASYVRRVALGVKPPTKDLGPPDARGNARGFKASPLLEAERAIKDAFDVQEQGGFSFVEFLSTCNVNWRMRIMESKVRLHSEIVPAFPPGLFVDRMGVSPKGVVDPPPVTRPTPKEVPA